MSQVRLWMDLTSPPARVRRPPLGSGLHDGVVCFSGDLSDSKSVVFFLVRLCYRIRLYTAVSAGSPPFPIESRCRGWLWPQWSGPVGLVDGPPLVREAGGARSLLVTPSLGVHVGSFGSPRRGFLPLFFPVVVFSCFSVSVQGVCLEVRANVFF